MDNQGPQNPQTTQPAPVQPAPAAPNPPLNTAQLNPGDGAGIAAFILSLLGLGLISLVIALISRNKSIKAGMSMTGLAKAALIISIAEIVVVTLAFLMVIALAAGSGFNDAAARS